MYQNLGIRRAKVTELVDRSMTINGKRPFALQMEAFNVQLTLAGKNGNEDL